MKKVIDTLAAYPFTGTWKLNPAKSTFAKGKEVKELTAVATEQGADSAVTVKGVAAVGTKTAGYYGLAGFSNPAAIWDEFRPCVLHPSIDEKDGSLPSKWEFRGKAGKFAGQRPVRSNRASGNRAKSCPAGSFAPAPN